MSSHKLTIKPSSEVLDLNEIHLSEENRRKINQLLEEFSYIDALSEYNLLVDNKVLLHGATGCGKTATANAIAKRLNKKVISLNLGGFVSSRLGETAKNISSVFASARIENAVLFIDEFDFIGKARDYDQKDSGEMKRAVNVLLQQIDSLSKKTLLICATNHIDIIDSALLRRFQLKLEYNMPIKEQLNTYYQRLLSQFPSELTDFQLIYNVSYAEAKDYVIQKVKANVIAKEKQKKQLLFSYGTLQLKNVQLKIYGRELTGTNDTLTGYKIENLQVTDKSILDENNQNFQPIAVQTNSEKDQISGKIFEITTEELFKTDLCKTDNCKRVSKTFESGIKAWVYIKNKRWR